MPQIIVTAGQADVPKQGTVTLRERVNATDFESERFAANLLERLGWAVEDATAAEREPPAALDTPQLVEQHEPQLSPDREPSPVGIA
jgi:hypothetical protein